MTKRLLLGLGALAAALALAAVALHLLVDANAFKPQIEQEVASRFKRTLHVDGDLRLALFPRIAIELPKARLTERESERTFAQAESARIGVALLPLLAGRLEAGRIEITGLVATIERHGDRGTSIDDLFDFGTRVQPPTAAQGKPAGDVRAFTVAGLELVDAQLTLIEDGRPVLKASKLNLSTGTLAAKASTPLTLAAAFNLPQARVEGALALSGMVDIDVADRTFGARKLQARLTGAIGGNRVDLHVDASRFTFGKAVSAEGLRFRFWPTGSAASDDSLFVEVAALDGTLQQIKAHVVRMNAEVRRGRRSIAATLTSFATGSLDAPSLQLTDLVGEVTINDPAFTEKRLKVAVTGSAALDGAGQTASLEFDAKSDKTALSATVHIAGFVQPKVRFQMRADQFNADRYLAPPSTGAAMDEQHRGVRKVEIGATHGLDVEGEARIEELQVSGIKATDVRLGVRAHGNRLDLAPVSATLYGGALVGSAFLAEGDNRVGLVVELQRVAIEPLIRDAMHRELVEGVADLRLDLTAEADALARTVSGRAALRLRDGSIKGLDLARHLGETGDLIRSGHSEMQRVDAAQKTDFAELTASFNIVEGTVSSDDLQASSTQLRLAGAGIVDLAAGTVDYTLQATPIKARVGPNGRELAGRREFTVPVRVAGPVDRMTYQIRWAALDREAGRPVPTDGSPAGALPPSDARRKSSRPRSATH